MAHLRSVHRRFKGLIFSPFRSKTNAKKLGSHIVSVSSKHEEWKKAFEINDSYINVTIPFDKEVMESHTKHLLKDDGAVNGAVNETKRKILSALKTNPSITRTELSKAIGIGTTTVYRYLKKLQDVGIIERIGSNKTGHWEIKK